MTLLAQALALLAGCTSSSSKEGALPERAPHVSHELLVRFRDGTGDAERDAVLRLVSAVLVRPKPLPPDLYLIRVEVHLEDAIRQLESQPAVLYAHPNYLLFGSAQNMPNDANFPLQWGLWVVNAPTELPPAIEWLNAFFRPVPFAHIFAPGAWQAHTGSGEFVVAVIDSGLAVDAPDFEGNLWKTESGFGWDFLEDVPVTFDTNGHGTAVASIIGARANDAEVDSIVGVIWSCKLMPLRFIGTGTDRDAGEVLVDSGTVADAVDAIWFSAANGARVSNNSYGARNIEDADALIEAIKHAGEMGQLFVTCAGNFPADIAEPGEGFYPASFDLGNMIVVTSYDYARDFADVGYSSTVVDIAAPGTEIYAISDDDGYYGFVTGTSFATAFVSGAAALVWDLHPKWSYARVKERILASARTDPDMFDKIKGGRVLNIKELLSE